LTQLADTIGDCAIKWESYGDREPLHV